VDLHRAIIGRRAGELQRRRIDATSAPKRRRRYSNYKLNI